MTTWITICDTCKRDDWTAETHDRPHRQDMAELVERHAAGRAVRTRRVSCLMGCAHGCNIAIQAPGKLAYTLGRFEPTEAAGGGGRVSGARLAYVAEPKDELGFDRSQLDKVLARYKGLARHAEPAGAA